MEEILKNLNFEPSIWLVNFLGFGLLLFTARQMVFIPIAKVIDERQGDIQKTYDQLDADQRQMQALKADYEARLAAVEAEGRERINNMIKEAQVTRDSVLADANSRAHELVSRAESEVAREKEQAMITLRKQVADLAIGAAERVIGDNLDEARSRKLVDEFIVSGGGPSPDYAKKVAVPTPAPAVVAEAKPSSGATAFVAGAVAVGVAAVAAVANAVKNAADDAREVAANVADSVADVADTVGDSLRGTPEVVATGAESTETAPVKKPRVTRKKSEPTEETGA